MSEIERVTFERNREAAISAAVDDAITLEKVRESDREWAEDFARHDLAAFVDFVLTAPKVSKFASEQLLDMVGRLIEEEHIDYIDALNRVATARPDLGARHRIEMLPPPEVSGAALEEAQRHAATPQMARFGMQAEVVRRAERLSREEGIEMGSAMERVLQDDPALARAVRAERRH